MSLVGSAPLASGILVFDFGIVERFEGDLSFRDGDRIRIVKKTDSVDDWWDGELNGMTGCFPANYVKMG